MNEKVKVKFLEGIKLRLNGEVLEFDGGDVYDLSEDTAKVLHERGVLVFGDKKPLSKKTKLTPVEETK